MNVSKSSALRRGRLKKELAGIEFLIPFIIGFVFLFAKPMIVSLVYTFHHLAFSNDGMALEWVGMRNYIQLVNDVSFLKQIYSQLASFFWQIPLKIVFSMLVALLMKDKFPGRLFFRCVMFLPVIFASETVMGLLNRQTGGASLATESNLFFVVNESAGSFMQELMAAFGLSDSLMSSVSYYINNIFQLAWTSGIQIVLFIVGLSAVPSDLYEVCTMEGATAWETFWKITFPLLSPTILLCTIYSIISTIMRNNSIIETISDNMQQKIEYACVQTWVYSAAVVLLVAVVYKLISKKTVYLD